MMETNLIHPMALIDPSARLGKDVEIGPYAIVEPDVELGDGCRIAAHAVIKRHIRMGCNNLISEHATIGGEPQDFKFKPCLSYVEIGDDNQFREGVTVHRSNHEGGCTRIGNRNFLMACSHVAHDCELGDQVVIANGTLLGGHVVVEDRAFISGAVTVHQFCRIGRLAMVAASARINQDCLPFTVTDGVPGRARGLNLIGLQRAGIATEEIHALKRAYRTLFHSGLTLAEALQRLEREKSAAVAELVQFIRTSERGFAHARGRVEK